MRFSNTIEDDYSYTIIDLTEVMTDLDCTQEEISKAIIKLYDIYKGKTNSIEFKCMSGGYVEVVKNSRFGLEVRSNIND